MITAVIRFYHAVGKNVVARVNSLEYAKIVESCLWISPLKNCSKITLLCYLQSSEGLAVPT